MAKWVQRYIYPVVAEQGEDGGYGLYFPDFPGSAILALDIQTAVRNAKDMLVDFLLELEDNGNIPPNPSAPEQIQLEDPADKVIFIDVFMPPYRDEAANKSVTKNCTLPKWLREAADEAGLNFSQILQNGLKEALGLDKRQER
ncbi:type II toxin-antitoxin system HicB family antitoxin [Paenibacillus tritici]|jgi:predicted RNase H-like HicB family nuclease|uniref:Type II toxin-antitoxin system HicB family antitoxin n=1 Tax=Paenibacillus tritici TaxID=1873425 RepID=A0ABX2DIP2_9BACL|nr:type II toxin-antitoxin system HicB family antitoxin [Paenibacillus tritici]NQX44452.1 type II toxin-antitoxin system HicB family antitoxin [Paenibacillus tritici]QUL53533.1 type II toxin-antitoxin system HicB family antitoxin [Paenibacillus tritici]